MSSNTVSTTTEVSRRFVAARLTDATESGARLADVVHDPDAFVAAARRDFASLGDPVYVKGIRSVTPGLGPVFGVRLPLMEAAHKTFKRGTREVPASLLLNAMDRLLREEPRELRWFAIWNLGRLLPTDPERTWQILRRAASEADEWITVDNLAHPYGDGILRDFRRWAEIEQLVYSSSRWERRLVGSTVATIPHIHGLSGGRSPAVVERGIALVRHLIGDAEPDVQKAISWALRTLAELDQSTTSRFLETETETACRDGDGNRAWVIRDSLSKIPEETATALRSRLEGIRRRPGAGSTSLAAAAAAALSQATNAGAAPRPAHNLGRASAP